MNYSETKQSFLKAFLARRDTSTVLAAIVLFIVFTFTSESFLTAFNLFNVGRTVALYVIVALGQAMAIIVGGMNLSLGAIGGLAVLGAGFFMEVLNCPPWLSVIAALLFGIAAGVFNGFIIIKLRLHSFIVTLATLFIFTGIVFGVTKGYPYTDIPKSFTIIGRQGIIGIPYLFILMVGILVVLHIFFEYTLKGRELLATGGNIDAARLSGVRTDRILLLANVLSGFFAALAGVLWVARMGSAAPATGQDWLIISFAVAVIGGTALQGGVITVVGLLASAIIMALIKNGMIMLQVNIYFEQSFLGGFILLAVALDRVRLSVSPKKAAKKGKEVQKAYNVDE
jgi:ribose transport system permease protein